MSGHPLDNAVWRALTSAQRDLAEGHGGARRFAPDVSPFAAVDRLDDEAWADLAALAALGSPTVLFRDVVPAPPDGWHELLRGTGHQLVVGPAGLRRVADLEATALSEADVAAMFDLVDVTQPGPFLRRTVTMGRYHGLFDGRRLLAMAGERLHLDGFTEISAVCTDPDVRGRGLASALTQLVADVIIQRGEVPFLHVASTNVAAQRVYERLGFEQRRTVDFVRLAPPRLVSARAEGLRAHG